MGESPLTRDRISVPVGRRAALAVPAWHDESASGVDAGNRAPVRPDARDLVALYVGRAAALDVIKKTGLPQTSGDEAPFAHATWIGRGGKAHQAPAPAPTVEPVPPTIPAQIALSIDASHRPPASAAGRGWRVRLSPSPALRRLFTIGLVLVIMLTGLVDQGLAQQRYRVQEGDTLESIAAEFGVDPAAIVASSWMANPPNPAPGEILIIPDPGQTPSEAARIAAEREGTSPWVGGAYTVQPGDSIQYISGVYGVDPNDLADLNDVSDWGSLYVGQRLLIPPASAGETGVTAEIAQRSPDSSVWVPSYVQQRNLSCEYASAFIATSAFGGGVSEDIFLAQVPQARNPHYGYRGDIDGSWGNYDDYGIYPEPLVPVLNEWGFAGEVFYSDGDPTQLINHIDQGHPVITWLAYWGDTGQVFKDDDRYTVFAGAHVVVVYGYDDEGVYVSDPASGRYRFFEWGAFLGMWGTMDGMSLAVYPF